MSGEHIEVTIDGKPWHVGSESAEYDAVHAVAGALLAGADSIQVEHKKGPEKAVFLGREDHGDGNVYQFMMPDGREVELGPNATVSELQNRV